MSSRTFLAVAAVGILGLLVLAVQPAGPENKEPTVPSISDDSKTGPVTVAENLDVPWDIEFLPDGDMLVTERPGTLLRIERNNGSTVQKFEVDGVRHRGEGGLLGLALHPNFTENSQIYLYMTTQQDKMLENRVVRYTLENQTLEDPETIISGLPGAPYHDGGRIAFGPEKDLYITAGDATRPDWAQDTMKLAGKILRVEPDGSIPFENPFGNEIYSYGHRNPQGITWIDDQLWATEHGRSGLKSGMDELNRIERGGNYGWPVIEGNETHEGMETPVINSGPDVTWAPAAAEYVNGSIYFAGLRGSALYEAEIENGSVTDFSKHLTGYGRLREVELGPSGDLYVTTSNTDGRGNLRSGDDRIIRLSPP
jgi:glucose/arabinose dehydrogenase